MISFSVQKFFYRQWTKNSIGTNAEILAKPDMAFSPPPIRSYSMQSFCNRFGASGC